MRKNKVLLEPQGLTPTNSLFRKPGQQEEPRKFPPMNTFSVHKLNEGTGPTCPKGAKVKVHYTGKLKDGKIFDSSVQRNQPFSF